MIIENEYGKIDISSDVLAGIVSIAAGNCYGVRGMAHRNKSDGIVQLLKRESYRKGINIEIADGLVNIELHIVVRHGINIAVIGVSIISNVRYNVEEMAGVTVGRVDVFVDSITAD